MISLSVFFAVRSGRKEPAPEEGTSVPAVSEAEQRPVSRPVSDASSGESVPSESAAEPSHPLVHNPDGSLKFPFYVPGTSLRVDAVRSYNGIYLEDGSDREIEGVAAAVITNTGKRCMEYAKITLRGSKMPMEFKVTGLKAGAVMVVMENSARPFTEQKYTAAGADAAESDPFVLCEDRIRIRELKNGELEITNLTDRDLPTVRIFYKFYMPKEKVYVGGITYTVRLNDLKAGVPKRVMTSHYAPGSSQIIRVKIEEKAA